MTAKSFKEAIKKQNITQEQAAKIIGVSRNVVNRWCKGKMPISPDKEIIIRETLLSQDIISSGMLRNFIARLKMDSLSFAEYYGTTQRTVNYWINGKAPIPQALQSLILIHPKMRRTIRAHNRPAKGQSLSPTPL